MLRRENLSIYLALFLGIFILLACQPKIVSSEEIANFKTSKPVPPSPTPSINHEAITIAAVGDIMLGSTFPNETRMPPADGADLLKEMTPFLSSADIAFGNLEGPILEGGVSEKCGPTATNCFAFRVPPRYGKYLKSAGFDVLSVANNHAGDFGEYGRSSTRKVLDELGIKYAGSNRAQFATTILDIKGKKVGFIGFAHNNISLNVNELDAARQAVAAFRKKVDILVVSFHGGAEGTDHQHVPNTTEMFFGQARGNLRAFTHTVIDAGADLVLGHGPHVMRGMELYKDHLIVYSMGNFCTYGWFTLAEETALTGIFELQIGAGGKFLGGKIHAGKQFGRGGPVLDKTGEGIKVIRQLSIDDFGASAPKIADDGTISVK